MRTGDLGKHFLSAKFDKLNKTAKTVRESKVQEGTPGCSDCEYMKDETDGMITTCDDCAAEMNEAPTDQYSASNSRRLLVQLDNMLSSMQKIVAEIYGTDNGDLQDQITVMDKYLKGFNSVIARAMKVVPTTEDAGDEGYPKTLDIKEDADVKAQYDELTDENQHGEAALLLAKTYGTELEAKLIQAIMDVHHARGNIMPEEQKLRDSIANKYYKQMMSDTFPANTSATQGKRMGAESIGEARTNMFGIQVRDIDDKIKDVETQIELAGRNKGGWEEKDIPKLESKLAHLKMKKQKGIKEEAEKNAYVCVHAKKGKHECHATSSYGAAKKAAAHWGLKSTAGIDAHLAIDEGVPGMEPEQKICCKHCGDELYGEPKTDCGYDINNPDQDNWILVDVDGDGDPDMKISYEPMPEGWMDDAKNAAGSTLRKVTDKVKHDYKKRKQLFGKGKL